MTAYNPMAGFNLFSNLDAQVAPGTLPLQVMPQSQAAANGGLFSMNSILGNPATGTAGWGGLALGAGSSLLSSYMGMKQYGQAKRQLDEARRQFDLNYNAQRKTLNTQMKDRQAARVASNPGAYQSVAEYMNENRI